MDSDLQPHQFNHHFQLPKPQMNTPPPTPVSGGLTRYRSAPCSYFDSFMDAVDSTTASDFPPPPPPQPRPLSPETESILARFMESDAPPPPPRPNKLYDIPENSPVMAQNVQYMAGVKQEEEQLLNLPPSSAQMMMSATSMEFPPQMKMGGGGGSGSLRGSSGLVRHRSSPAGLFDDIVIENGFLVDRETGSGNFGSGGRSSNNTQISFSSPGETQISVPGNSITGAGGRRFANGGEDDFMTNFGSSSWDDQNLFSGQEMGGSSRDFNSPENQNREGRSLAPGMLAHHLSLPKGSMEKLLQFQDAVPCKLRAKRGCATHPRSIAERVRRTKISERMRKLQDLVPNMDKQTNTSDMLDLAVDYIKDLQTQLKSLSDNRAQCTCTS